MKIFLDNIIFSLQRAGGISVYWYELLRRMLRDNLSLHVIEDRQIGGNIFREKISIPQEIVLPCKLVPTTVSRYLPLFVKLPKYCIFHSSYYRLPWFGSGLVIETVYDFTYEYFRTGLPRLAHSFQKRLALQNADGIICISESTKRDLLKFIPKVSEKQIRVIYLGYSDEFYPLHNDKFEDMLYPYPFLVYVGDRSDYKNFSIAVRAVSQVSGYGLIIVGGGDLSAEHKFLLDQQLEGRYQHLDRLPNEKLNDLYNNAHALIYPSSYEGFGIPVIEAMAAGCPVIAANVSSIPEAAGDAGLLVDTIADKEFALKIIELQNVTLRDSLIQRGYKNAQRFSWERCYQETIAFYRDIQLRAIAK